MTLHMVGDTGGVLDPTSQQLVASGLEQDASVTGEFGTPAFLYHLGDVSFLLTDLLQNTIPNSTGRTNTIPIRS